MLFERIVSEGISHYSYMIGDGSDAVVIDPRRDVDAYLVLSERNNMKITHVLETHRHEDFIVGSTELENITGAKIYHADRQLEYKYGREAKDGKKISVGRLELEPIYTPGHTLGSMSYLLYDPDGAPWVIFTGDTLFSGDVGRVDFMGESRLDEMAELLYESIFNKILPIGDGTLACPAHGAGSVCGDTISERLWTTIGMEKENNPKLRYTEKERFTRNVAKMLDYPPYFKEMERRNLMGTPLMRDTRPPRALSVQEFKEESDGAFILDSRMELGFSSSHIPGSQYLWANGIPNYAGWFVPYGKDMVLVSEMCDVEKTITHLRRLGYDNIKGYLSGGIHSWLTSGNPSWTIQTTTVQDLCKNIDQDYDAWILDVRSEGEIESEGRLPLSHNIPLTVLGHRASEIPKDRKIHIFCGSGLRAMIAASILRRDGWKNMVVMLGGVFSWNSLTCPLDVD